MGCVYKATDQDTGLEYALKVLSPALAGDPQALIDLKKEVAIAHTLGHQNLLKIIALASAGPLTYVVMEYVRRRQPRRVSPAQGAGSTTEEFRKIAPQLLAGLEYLHEKARPPRRQTAERHAQQRWRDQDHRLRHRPDHQGTAAPRPGDGGTGRQLVTWPPSSCGGDVLNRRTDVYAVAMTLLRLLTEKFPFDPRDRQGIVRWHLDPKHQVHSTGQPKPDAVLRKAPAVDPGARYAGCKELLRALEESGAFTPAPVVAEVAPAPPRTPHPLWAKVTAEPRKWAAIGAAPCWASSSSLFLFAPSSPPATPTRS